MLIWLVLDATGYPVEVFDEEANAKDYAIRYNLTRVIRMYVWKGDGLSSE